MARGTPLYKKLILSSDLVYMETSLTPRRVTRVAFIFLNKHDISDNAENISKFK